MDGLAVSACAAAVDLGLRVDHEGQDHRILDRLNRDATGPRRQPAFGVAEALAIGHDASFEHEEVGPPAGLRRQDRGLPRRDADVAAMNGIADMEVGPASGRPEHVTPYVCTRHRKPAVLDAELQIFGMRPNEDLQHAPRRVVVADALFAPKTPAGVHDHEMIRVGREMAALGGVVAHHTGRDP